MPKLLDRVDQDIASEVHELRGDIADLRREVVDAKTELGGLTQGLLNLLDGLTAMDGKLNVLMEAAAPPPDRGDPLSDLLHQIVAETQGVSSKLDEVIAAVREVCARH